jgi:hypothetical protein
LAIDYIWKKFFETYFDELTLKTMKELEQFNADLAHRPLHIGSEEYLVFEKYLEKRSKDIQTKYPFVKRKF